MTRKLPAISGLELIRSLRVVGYEVVRVSGSHHFLRNREAPSKSVVVPVHGKRALKKGTLVSILKRVGLTAEDLGYD